MGNCGGENEIEVGLSRTEYDSQTLVRTCRGGIPE